MITDDGFRRHAQASRLFRAIAGAGAGAAAWFTFGVIALDESAARESFGLLPSLGSLAALIASGVVLAVLFRRPSTLTLGVTMLLILPWLAPPLAPLMLWAGPLAIVVWGLVAADALRAALRRGFPSSKGAPAVAAAAVAVAIAFLGDARRVTGDEPHYLIAASSLVHDFDLDLKNDYDLGRHQDFYAGSLEPRHSVPVSGGREYPFHGLGPSVVALPGYAIGGVIGARMAAALVSIIGIVFLWDAVFVLTSSAAAGWGAVGVLLLSLPFAGQIGAFYPDPLAAAACSIAIWSLVRIERRAAQAWWPVLLGGVALAALPWLHARMSNLAIAFGIGMVVACWRSSSARAGLLAAFLAAPVLSAATWFATLKMLYGTANPMALFSTAAASTLAPLPSGALGLLADHEYGLLPYAPALVLAIGGIKPLRTLAPIAAWSGLLAVLTTFIVAALFDWWGGFATPARFLVPILPVLAVSVGCAYDRASAQLRAVFIALLTVGASLLALAAAADDGQLMRTAPDGTSTIFEWASAIVDLPAAMPSLFRAGTSISAEVAVVACWIAAAMLLASAAAIVLRLRPAMDPFPVVTVCVLAWLSVGAWAGWQIRDVSPWTSGRSQVALLHATGTGWLDTGWSRGHRFEHDERIIESMRVASRGDDPSTLLHVPWVPQGRYRVQIEHGHDAGAPASLSLEIGREAWPLWTWPAGTTGPPGFALVMPVHSVLVKARDNAASDAVWLRPTGRVADPRLKTYAERVTRYGDWLVYSLDRFSSMEAGGFWCGGDRSTRIVVADLDGRTGAFDLVLEAGPVPVRVQLTSEDTRHDVELKPGQRKTVTMPAPRRIAPVVIAVEGRFRAAEAFGTRADRRSLGVFVEIAQPTSDPRREAGSSPPALR